MRKDKNKSERGEFSRRDFLIGAGAVVVGGAIGAGITYPLVSGKISTLEILNPVGDPAIPIIPAAPRLDSLDGKRIGIYIAKRANAFELMDRVAENLAERFPTAEILTHETNPIWAKPSYDRTAEEMGIFDGILAQEPDCIIMGLSA